MSSLIISTKNVKELQFVRELLNKMKIRNKLLTTEEKEDLGLAALMSKANRNKKVSRDTIMKKLK
ncbi:MAG: hypothetical protein SGI96_18600 [Bacteroidota bacterium]|nr:hypothetical protein [Chitinophagaceae bacterium]MDZ4810253.1 hypothetical protein [Bacteroidota bacterium]